MMKHNHAVMFRDWKHLNTIWDESDLMEVDAEVWNLIETPTRAKACQLITFAMSAWWDGIEKLDDLPGGFDDEAERIGKKYGFFKEVHRALWSPNCQPEKE
jgi:hypothetical protein